MAFDETYVASPCVRVCTLDDAGVCVGCLRTLEEIKDWGVMPPERKRALLAELGERRAARPPARPGWFRRRG